MKKFIKNWGLFILHVVFFAICMVFYLVPIMADFLPEPSQLSDTEAICISWGFFTGLFYASFFCLVKNFIVDLIKERRKKRIAAQYKEVPHD